MTRPVILLSIGGSVPTPVTAPVFTPASWFPSVYVPPTPVAPASLLATPVADAVLLTWVGSGIGATFTVERAPDVAGSPGTWAVLATTTEQRYLSVEPSGYAAHYRVKAEVLGRVSAWSLVVVAAPVASNPPRIALSIVGGVVTINCVYQQFYLRLSANATVVFVNVREAQTILIEIEQVGGFTLNFGASVVPVSGVAYVVSSAAGAVDLVGLATNNSGSLWRLTAQQPNNGSGGGGGTPGAPLVSITPSPASNTATGDGTTPVAPSVAVTASATGGTAPYTHAWTRADSSGGTSFLIDNAAIAAPTFSIASGTAAYSATQTWRDTVTDATPLSGQATVDVTLTRTAPIGATWDGASAEALSLRTHSTSSCTAWLEFKPDGTWELWAQAAPGIAAMRASGAWAAPGVTGSLYEVKFTPTHAIVSGLGGVTVNDAAAYAALGSARQIRVGNSIDAVGNATDEWSVQAQLRLIASPGTVTSGVVTIHIESERV